MHKEIEKVDHELDVITLDYVKSRVAGLSKISHDTNKFTTWGVVSLRSQHVAEELLTLHALVDHVSCGHMIGGDMLEKIKELKGDLIEYMARPKTTSGEREIVATELDIMYQDTVAHLTVRR